MLLFFVLRQKVVKDTYPSIHSNEVFQHNYQDLYDNLSVFLYIQYVLLSLVLLKIQVLVGKLIHFDINLNLSNHHCLLSST